MTPQAMARPTAAVIGILLGALVSEDAATLGAASLASAHLLDPSIAIASAALGIWIGDLGLYALAFFFGPALAGRKWFSKRVSSQKLQQAGSLAENWGTPALAASRFLPGTRLPATVVSGFLKMPLPRFAIVTGVCSVVWVAGVFTAVTKLKMRTSSPLLAVVLVAASLGLFGLIVARWKSIANAFQRWQRWEFWPAWLFYAPVTAMCAWLAIKYRGLTLPALANLNQKHGGIVGESKFEILQQISRVAPKQTADAQLLPAAPLGVRLQTAMQLAEAMHLDFPFVLKPDVGQRGAGFKVMKSWLEVKEYLEVVTAPVLLQRYVAGPHEAGIFYYRWPGQLRGEIFAITEKAFPYVIGNGRSTLEELIEAGPRIRLIAGVYKKRFADELGAIVPRNTRIRLVEAGNHCQGCIFREGKHLMSQKLAARINAISSSIPGFFIGRYDVRYVTDADLRDGIFTIIELNGAASEATSIYDERTTLWQAYRILYQQWELVYQIGAINRAGGAKRVSFMSVVGEWLTYQRRSAAYPVAD